MSARHAFVPRPSSCVPSSEPLSRSTDGHAQDGDKTMSVHGNGKARSINAFLSQKRGGTDAASQGPGLGRANSGTSMRSFEGLLRPEMVPMSIIPYPATAQLSASMKQPGAGETPRKTAGPGGFEFPRPMTPESAPRNLKKAFGMFAENREDEATSNANAHGNGTMFMGTSGDADGRIGPGTRVGGYMRVFEGPSGGASAGGLQSGLEREMVAPVPGYALGGLGANLEDEGCEIDRIFARSSRSSGATEEEVGMERTNNSQRSLGGAKRGMHREDMEENGRYTDEGQRRAKRMRQTQHDPEDYFPISSPRMPATPRPPTSSVDVPDPTLVIGMLFENVEEFISLEEIEADWKRWKECTREEWLKGADELAKDYTDILNMVKDHLTEKVLAFSNMASSVEEKQAEVNHNIEMIHGKGNIVRANISKLGMKN